MSVLMYHHSHLVLIWKLKEFLKKVNLKESAALGWVEHSYNL